MLDLEILIRKLCAIDGNSTSAVALIEISTLCHKATDNAMEYRLLVRVFLGVISTAQGSEVFSCLRDDILSKLHTIK